MRRQEALIRSIISETLLLERYTVMSILPPSVPAELYVDCFRRLINPGPGWSAKFTPENRERLIKLGLDSMLSQKEAEEVADLGIMSMGSGEDFPFDLDEAPKVVIEALGYDPVRAKKLISRIKGQLYDSVAKDVSPQIFWTLANGWAAGQFNRDNNTPRGMKPDIEKLQKINRGDIEEAIRLMDSMYEMSSNMKDIPKIKKQQLMKIIGPDGSGFLQALEIYSII